MSNGLTFHPTMNLRFVDKLLNGPTDGTTRILQQMWTAWVLDDNHAVTGVEQEWRDVPLVKS